MNPFRSPGLFHRVSSYLVLFSFLFQTLWPCWSWASDLSTTESMGSRSRLSSFTSLEDFKRPTLYLPTIDTMEEPFPDQKSHSPSLTPFPSLKALARDPKELGAFLKTNTLYQDLLVTEECLSWSAHGFDFTLEDTGKLLVKSSLTKPSSPVLRLYNPNGSVSLSENLTLKHVLVKAESVVHEGKTSRIETLDVWAVGNDWQPGLFLNEQNAHLQASAVTLHEGDFENQGKVSIQEKGFLNLKGHDLTNLKEITLGKEASILNAALLRNGLEGVIRGQNATTPYTLQGKRLENVGQILGVRTLSFETGVNQGTVKSKELALSVEDLFVNEQNCLFDITETFSTSGNGTFLQKGDLKARTLKIDNRVFKELSKREQTYKDVTIGSNVHTWLHGKKSILNAETLTLALERQGVLNSSKRNEGIIRAGKLINRASSSQNKNIIEVKRLEQLGTTLVNEEGATLEVEEDASFETDSFTNKGTVNLKGKTRGRITHLINHAVFYLEGDSRLWGQTLTNHKIFRAYALLAWLGDTLTNHDTMTIFDNQIAARKQVINHHLLRWTHNTFRTWHLLNRGLMERTQDLENKTHRPFTVSTDASTTFKKGTVENRGVIHTQTSYTPRMTLTSSVDFTHWNNSGMMTLQTLSLNAQSFANTGKVTVLGSVTGQVQTLINHGEIAFGTDPNSQRRLKVTTFHNAPDAVLALGRGVHHFETVQNQGTVIALKGMNLTLGAVKNTGVIESTGGLKVLARESSPENVGSSPGKEDAFLTLNAFQNPSLSPSRAYEILKDLGVLKTKKDLTLEVSPLMDAVSALKIGEEQWQHGGKLSLRSDSFVQKENITHSGGLELTLKRYKNPRYSLIASALTLIVDDLFEIGEAGSFGSLQALKDKDKKDQTPSLTVILQKGTLNLEWAQLFGHGKTTVRANNGVVTVGAGIQERITRLAINDVSPELRPLMQQGLEGQLQGDPNWLPHYNHPSFGYDYNASFTRSNGAFVASNDAVSVFGKDGIVLNYANLQAEGIELETSRSAGITNLSGALSSKKQVVIRGGSYTHTQLPPYEGVRDEGVWHFRKDFPQSERAHLESLGKMVLDVNAIHNYGGLMMGIGGIYDGGGRPLHSINGQQAIYYLKGYHQRDFYDYSFDDPGAVYPFNPMPYLTHNPDFVSGGDLSLKAYVMRQMGFSSGRNVTFTADSFTLLALASVLGVMPTPGLHSTFGLIQNQVTERGLVRQQTDGRVVCSVPIQETQLVDPKTAPVLGQREIGFRPEIPLYAPSHLSLSALFNLMLKNLGRVYEGDRSGLALIAHYFKRGSYYAQLGMLETPEKMKAISETIVLLRKASVNGNQLMVLDAYFPEGEIDPDAGRAGTIKGDTITLIGKELNLNNALVKAMRDATLESTETDITLLGSVVKALDIVLKSKRDVLVSSLVHRTGGGDTYEDHIVQAALEAGNTLKVEAEQDIRLKGIQSHSGVQTMFKANRHIIDEAVALAKQTFHQHKRGYTRDKHIHQKVSHHTSGGAFVSTAKGVQVLYAHIVEALDILIEGDRGVFAHEVHDIFEHESKTEKKGNWLSGSSKETSQSRSARSQGVRYTSDDLVKIKSKFGSLELTNFMAKARKVLLEAIGREVIFHPGTNDESSTKTSSESSAIWQSQESERQEHKTYMPCRIYGEIEIRAGKVSVAKVRDQALDWLNRVEVHGTDQIDEIFLEEVHKYDSVSVEGPTAAFAAVVALAAGIASAGTGSALGGLVSGSIANGATAAVVSTMTAAGFSALAAQAAVDFLSAQGDIRKAAQSLATRDTMKAVLLSAATAGVMKGIGITVDGYFEQALFKTLAGTGFSMATGMKLEEALKNEAKLSLVKSIGAVFANKIGDAYGGKDHIDPVTHKALHACLGAATGAILSHKDPKSGALAGAIGAAVAETVADLMNKDEVTQRVLEKANQQGLDPKDDAFANLIHEELKPIINFSLLSSAVATMLAGQNVDTSIHTATNALENNFGESFALKILQKIGEGIIQGGKQGIKKAGNLLSKIGKKSHPKLPEGIKKGDWQPPKEALDKVKPELGRGEFTSKGEGFKWMKTQKAKDMIRIDKGDPTADFSHQQVDHVRIQSGGKVIGRSGKEIKETTEFLKPAKNPDSHIPLSEWVKWKEWNKP